jgi:hypothetical protein
MRFMIMHKNDPHTEAGEPPPMDLVEKMGQFIGEHAQAGRFLDGKQKAELTRVIDGPFSESKELIGGFAVLELSGMDEAIDLCRRYAEILGGTLEIDVRPLAEPEVANPVAAERA